jgi:ADP-ribose pyrophosphatase YjhB (NUDIX family)
MKPKRIIDQMGLIIGDPSKGLPEDIFLFISGITPLVNVDLLIKNERNHTLLTWRDDDFYPAGWHIPGGIIRFKERIFDRIGAVAASELGARVRFNKEPLVIRETIHPSRRTRGHFISMLFECRLVTKPDKRWQYDKGNPKAGQWAWHSKCPDNLISVHAMYRKFM